MSTEPFFPFSEWPHESGSYVESPREFKDIFLAKRKELRPDTGWYAYSVEILSPTLVTLHVFDMRDNVYGGVGDRIYTIENVTVDRKVTAKAIHWRARSLAKERRRKELEDAETALLKSYAQQILDGIEGGVPGLEELQ